MPKNQQLLIDLLIRHEGLELKAYKDSVGLTTIGVGRNVETFGITREEAIYLLENDIGRIKGELHGLLPDFYLLSDARQAALIDMGMMGITALKGFVAMLEAVKRKDFEAAAANILDSKWATQVGKRAKEVASLMRTGAF